MSVYRDHYEDRKGPPCPWCQTLLVFTFSDDESYGYYECQNNECIASKEGYTFYVSSRNRIFDVDKEVETTDGPDRIQIKWPKPVSKPKVKMKGALDRFIQSPGECQK